MERAEYIQAIKTALDAGDRAAVERCLGQPGPVDVKERARTALGQMPRPVVKPGYYTVMLADGHVTFRVEQQAADAKFAPGETIISRLIGPQNESDYKGVAFAKRGGGVAVWTKQRGDARLVSALDILTGDPKAAALGFARESKRCYICNRLLTEPESLARGIGPVCAERGY